MSKPSAFGRVNPIEYCLMNDVPLEIISKLQELSATQWQSD